MRDNCNYEVQRSGRGEGELKQRIGVHCPCASSGFPSSSYLRHTGNTATDTNPAGGQLFQINPHFTWASNRGFNLHSNFQQKCCSKNLFICDTSVALWLKLCCDKERLLCLSHLILLNIRSLVTFARCTFANNNLLVCHQHRNTIMPS